MMVALLALQLVAAADSRPAGIPLLAYGQVVDEEGNNVDATVFITSYNPYTNAINVQTSALTGVLKSGYFFTKLHTAGTDLVEAAAEKDGKEGNTIHKITDDDNYRSYFKFRTITLGEQQIPQATIELQAGWNNMILPITPTDNSIESVLAPVQYDIIWKEAGSTHIAYSPLAQAGEFNTLEAGVSYWIYVREAVTLTIY